MCQDKDGSHPKISAIGKYTDTIPAGGFYESWSGYNDELVLAAAWIAKASGEQADVDKAEDMWDEVTTLPCIITHSKILTKYYLLSKASIMRRSVGLVRTPARCPGTTSGP